MLIVKFHVPERLLSELDDAASFKGVSRSELLRRMLDDYLLDFRQTKQRLYTEKQPGQPGRPRLAGDEKKFRENVTLIEERFVRLREIRGLEIFRGYLADIQQEFEACRDSHDFDRVAWLADPGHLGELSTVTSWTPEERTLFFQRWRDCIMNPNGNSDI